MPLYEFHHIISLTSTQRDALASGVTDIHSQKFSTPRLFVNVSFTDVSAQPYYVAGKPRTVNKLIANVRHGPSRPQALWDDVCTEINALWASLVGNKGEKELRAIFIMGGMIGGSEAGFAIPKAGEDGMWMRENLEGFRRKAEGGDVEFEELVEAAEKLNGVEGGKGVNGANGSNGA